MTKATFLVALFVWTLPGLGDGDTSPQADLASDLATRFWFTPGCIAIVPISIRAIETSTRRLRSKACTYLTASGTAERPIVIKAAAFKPGVHLGQSGHRNGGGC